MQFFRSGIHLKESNEIYDVAFETYAYVGRNIYKF